MGRSRTSRVALASLVIVLVSAGLLTSPAAAAPRVDRVAGADRVGTAVALSQAAFPSAPAVVLARADAYPDALAASLLAAEVGGPVLLTPSDALAPAVAAELGRLGATRAYLVGGAEALRPAVADALTARGVATQRVSGADRFATAAAVADEVVRLGGRVDGAIVARADGFADALAAGNLAVAARRPILLSASDALSGQTADALTRLVAPGGEVVVAGGEAALGAAVESDVAALGLAARRIGGADRYATGVAMVSAATAAGAGLDPVVLASGREFPDALAAVPAAHALGGALVLVSPAGVYGSPATRDLLLGQGDALARIVIAGGEQAVSERVVEAFTQPGAGLVRPTRLRAFTDCDDVLAYYRDHAADLVTEYGLGYSYFVNFGGEGAAAGVAADAAVPAGGGVSGTNVQEEGVDEPDVVKTDGRLLVTTTGGRLQVVDVTGDAPVLRGSLDLPFEVFGAELLLDGATALLLSDQPGRTELARVDLTDPDAPRVLDTTSIEGFYLSARMVDGVVRVITQSGPDGIVFTFPQDESEQERQRALEENRQAVAQAPLEAWLPDYELRDPQGAVTDAGALVDCRGVAQPEDPSGLATVTVSTLRIDGAGRPAATAIAADGQTVYASAQSLYVATSRFGTFLPTPELVPDDGAVTTEIHAFDITDPTTATYRGSGSVDGFVLNQFAFSEHEGDLRVATTSSPPWTGDEQSDSGITVLREVDGTFLGIGQIGGLGLGEQIQAVRFLGDLGVVVTFRQTDPLYTVDLGDPASPRLLGELKVPGFSAYLHPVGEGLLLGVGQDATEEGQQTGAQVSLFDIADPTAPALLDTVDLSGGADYSGSPVEFDHRAFTFWAPTGLAVVPVQRVSGGQDSYEERSVAAGVAVEGRTLRMVGEVEHPPIPAGEGETATYPAQISRAAVVGDALLTVSPAGVGADDLATLAGGRFAAFPPAEGGATARPAKG